MHLLLPNTWVLMKVGEADAVFDAGGGVVALELEDDAGGAAGGDVVELDERRVADEVGDAGGDVHGRPFEVRKCWTREVDAWVSMDQLTLDWDVELWDALAVRPACSRVLCVSTARQGRPGLAGGIRWDENPHLTHGKERHEWGTRPRKPRVSPLRSR